MKKILLFFLLFIIYRTDAQSIGNYFEKIRNNEAELTAFISQMPKGGDLHNHYHGSVYTESYINWVIEKDYAINTQTLQVSPELTATNNEGWIKFSALEKSGQLNIYKEKLMQLWSAKDYNSAEGGSEQHFFATFGAFSAAGGINFDKGLQELKSRAKAENVSYIELMFRRIVLTDTIHSNSFYISKLENIQQEKNIVELKKILDTIYGMVIQMKSYNSTINQFNHWLDSIHFNLHIDDSSFTMRYQNYIIRTQDPVTTFKNLVASFDAAQRDTLLVGVNIVAPEDNETSMHDYWLHMQMYAWCHEKFKQVNYSMHAGELAEGFVQPEELTWHITSAVLDAGAQRIGHGVDIAYEKNNYSLLHYMSAHHIPVEINLTSNEFILGVKNDKQPILLYKHFHVPVVICTDDAGILRTSLTEQYVLLAMRYKEITYEDIKNFVYNGIEYSFIESPQKKQELRKDLDVRFERFEHYILSQKPQN